MDKKIDAYKVYTEENGVAGMFGSAPKGGFVNQHKNLVTLKSCRKRWLKNPQTTGCFSIDELIKLLTFLREDKNLSVNFVFSPGTPLFVIGTPPACACSEQEVKPVRICAIAPRLPNECCFEMVKSARTRKKCTILELFGKKEEKKR